MAASLDVPTFVARWQASTLTECSAVPSPVADLYRMIGQRTPPRPTKPARGTPSRRAPVRAVVGPAMWMSRCVATLLSNTRASTRISRPPSAPCAAYSRTAQTACPQPCLEGGLAVTWLDGHHAQTVYVQRALVLVTVVGATLVAWARGY